MGPVARVHAEPIAVSNGPVRPQAGGDEQFDQPWSPGWLFSDDSTLFRASSHELLVPAAPGEGLITGLTSVPAESVVVYARANGDRSRILALHAEAARPAVVADASQLGDDLWFHGVLSLSPDKRWLLAMASDGRRERPFDGLPAPPGDLWLIDCLSSAAPCRVAHEGTLLSSAWSPSAQRVVSEWSVRDGDACEIFLLDVESGERRDLLDKAALAVWSLDGTIRLRVREGAGNEVIVCRVGEAGVELDRHTSASVLGVPRDSLWSYFGELGAWICPDTEQRTLLIAPPSGPSRTVTLKAPVRRLLAWSHGGRLLGFVTADGHLGMAVGVLNEVEFRRTVAASPPPLLAEVGDASFELPAFGTATLRSPIHVPSAERVLATWTARKEGPCLVYVGGAGTEAQYIAAIAFTTFSLRDLRLDPTGDMREQVILQEAESDFSQLWQALNEYSSDHQGKFPPNDSGAKLAEDLRGYTDPQVLSPAYESDKMGVRLLMPGGDFHTILWEHTIRERHFIPIAEMDSDDGCVFVLYADGHSEQVEPVRRVIDQPPYPEILNWPDKEAWAERCRQGSQDDNSPQRTAQ
jgi:hypothetical protein